MYGIKSTKGKETIEARGVWDGFDQSTFQNIEIYSSLIDMYDISQLTKITCDMGAGLGELWIISPVCLNLLTKFYGK